MKKPSRVIPEDKRGQSHRLQCKKARVHNNNAKSLGVTIGKKGKKGGEVPPMIKDINLDEESKVRKRNYDDLMGKRKDTKRTQMLK